MSIAHSLETIKMAQAEIFFEASGSEVRAPPPNQPQVIHKPTAKITDKTCLMLGPAPEGRDARPLAGAGEPPPPPPPCVATACAAEALPAPCVATAVVAETLPSPCVSTAVAVAETAAFALRCRRRCWPPCRRRRHGCLSSSRTGERQPRWSDHSQPHRAKGHMRRKRRDVAFPRGYAATLPKMDTVSTPF